VIINELGAISVDHRLISGHATAGTLADVVVMKNGCLCCAGDSPGSELEGILNKLLEMSAVDTAMYDYMLIETSGLADPTAVVHLLFRNEMRRSAFVLDGVVTLVDATNVHRHLHVAGHAAPTRPRVEVARQIALADVVLLTKADLLADEPGGLRAVEAAVLGACPAATVLAAHPSVAPLRRLLGIDAFRHRHVHLAPEPARGPAPHSLGAQTVCLRVTGAMPLDGLQRWLQAVVAAHEAELYRLKGTVAIVGETRRFVVQGVHGEVRGHFDDGDAAAAADDDDNESVLVLIAATGPPPAYAYLLDELGLQASLQACAREGEGTVHIVDGGRGRSSLRRREPRKAGGAGGGDGDECVECEDEDSRTR
jgi:G3E family GTPase